MKAEPMEMEDYPPSEEASSEMEETQETPEAESIDQEEAESDSAVVANKVLAPGGEPLKEGDEITLVVVKNYGDESEIRYATKKPGKEVQPPRGMMDEANAELDQMDQY